MSRNGSGGYSLPSNSWNPALNWVSATAADWQALINDVATAIQQSVSADGQTPITGNLQMGGNKLTGLGAGSGTGQSLRYEQLFSQGTLTDIASAATTDIGSPLTTLLRVTGTTGITSFGTNYNGPRFLIFAGAVLLTHSATLVLPTGANITTAAGDSLIAIPISGGWQVMAYQRASGSPLVGGDLLNTTRIDVASATTVDLTASAPNTRNINITGTTTIAGFTVAIGQTYFVRFNAALTLTNSASLVTQTGADLVTAAGDTCILRSTAANTVEILSYVKASANATNQGTPPVRQTILNGPVDTSGLSAFGGSTGGTTVTASGTLTATASNGTTDRTGTISNPSWTSLSTNGTMYLYLDIASNGTCTTGSTTLAPNYRWGGADVVTNNQFTFNIQEMVGKVGNGSVATQTYRVFVGEVTVSGSVVTVITWYALMGRYDSGFTNTLPGGTTSVSRNHNLGYSDYVDASLDLKCLTSEFGYPVGGIVPNIGTYSAGISPPQTLLSRNSASFPTSNAGNPWALMGSGGGAYQSLTAASWAYRVRAKRNW